DKTFRSSPGGRAGRVATGPGARGGCQQMRNPTRPDWQAGQATVPRSSKSAASSKSHPSAASSSVVKCQEPPSAYPRPPQDSHPARQRDAPNPSTSTAQYVSRSAASCGSVHSPTSTPDTPTNREAPKSPTVPTTYQPGSTGRDRSVISHR